MKRDLRNDIIEHLKRKGNYDETVDDYLIDILMENIKYSEQMKANILQYGLIVTIPNGNGIATTRENPAFNTYQKCLVNITQCGSKLGINRKDRIALKLLEEKTIDEFDKIFQS